MKANPPAGGLQIQAEATVQVGDLVDDHRNVNVHDERNLEAITASLRRFGQPERLIVRKSDSLVFSGNGRLEAMRRLGWKTARVQYVEGTDDECRAYAVAANRTARLSRFDDDNLAELLQELKAADPTMPAATGYNEEEMQRLLRDIQKQPPKNGAKKGAMGLNATCPECWSGAFEPVALLSNGPPRPFPGQGRMWPTVLRQRPLKTRTAKPPQLYRVFMEASSAPGELVVDPYCGLDPLQEAALMDPPRRWASNDVLPPDQVAAQARTR